MRFSKLLVFSVLFASVSFATQAADIEVKQNPVPTYSFAIAKYKLDKGDQVQWIVFPEPNEIEELSDGEYAHAHFNGSAKKYVVYALVTNFKNEKQFKKRIEVVMGTAPQPPPPGPVPPDVDPKPIDPPVVNSFRVLFVQDPVKTLTQSQFNAIYADIIDKYLDTVCTKVDGQSEWRRWSSRQKVGDETATLKTLWESVHPKLTAIPAVVIEVNGKADILDLPSSPEETIALVKKYRGNK